MLDKLAMGMLGNAVSGILGGLIGGEKKGGVNATGFEDVLLAAKEKTEAEKMGINASDPMSAGTEEALGLLREMTSGGIEGYFKYLMKELREKVMDEMGVSEAELAAMGPEQRKAVEDAINEAVKEKLAEVMGVDREKMEAAMNGGEKGGLVDIMVQIESNKAYKNKPEIV